MEIISKFTEGSEALAELHNYVNSIAFLRNLIDPNREKAKQRPRDSQGRIIVNVTQPHILEDMDYFRKPALAFLKTGKYTEAYPSADPNSPYKKFWDEEIQRCIYGYVRQKDGEWITGYHYYYINYCPILKSKIIGTRTKDGSVRADRVEGFPDMWDGDYLFFHYVEQAESTGEYASVLKARGKGYSFKAASMLIRNYELFARSKSFAFAGDSEYLDNDGILNKAWAYMDFANKHVGFAKKLRLKDSMMEKTAGYRKPGDPTDHGMRSTVSGVTLKNNPGKSRGKRGKLIIWEESGIFIGLLKAWRIAQKSMEDGNRVFGLMLALGTGGEKGANFEGLEALFYKCQAYRVKAISNVFDKNIINQICGFFVPEYMNRADCYDKNGNSNVIKALEEVVANRLKLKYSGVDAEDLAQAIAEEAITPQEAVMRTEGTVFPIEELKNYLASVAPNADKFTATHYVGELYFTTASSVEFKPVFSMVPLREYPIRKSDTTGAVEIFEMPKKSPDGLVPRGRYIGGADTVDDEYGSSLFSVFIFDLLTDNIVAEWTGRFRTAAQNFDVALKLAIFYNAEINYENKLKGMFAHFDKRNALAYLSDMPNILQDMDYASAKERYGNKKKGTPPTPVINSWGRRLQADWMLTYNPYYEDMSLTHIRSLGYIREAISWNILGNFDRVSAMNMVFILRQDKLKAIERMKENPNDVEDDYNNDEFFKTDSIVCEDEFVF